MLGYVHMMNAATLCEVKRAMADQLGRPEILQKGRIVRNQGEAFIASILIPSMSIDVRWSSLVFTDDF